jgi:hypothetical protein
MSISDVIPQIPVADDPFQKLLEAAWVLQESCDQRILNQIPFDFGTGQRADGTLAAQRVPLPAQASDRLQSVPIDFWLVPQPPTLLGSVTLSTDSFSEYGLEPPDTDQPEPVPSTVEAREIEPPSSVADTHLLPPLRLRLNASHARTAVFCAALVLTATIYAILRIPASDQRKTAVASPLTPTSATEFPKANRTLPGATQTSVRAATVETGAHRSSASLSSTTAETRPSVGVVPASGPTSHKTVTDPSARYAMESMSRYEIQTLQRQAKYGDDSAALILGMAYETGHYVRQNCKTAAEWVERAAKDGNPAAEYNLGLRYQTGDGLNADRNLATTWIRKSALKKYAQARSFLSTTSQP